MRDFARFGNRVFGRFWRYFFRVTGQAQRVREDEYAGSGLPPACGQAVRK
jgi:hypothetical protein